jgi:hypothetical protein
MNLMTVNFSMVQNHRWDIEALENMMPWEREVYVIMLNDWVNKENERIEKENSQMRAASRR